MTTENWLSIALISSTSIAQLLAPTLAEFVKSRINQPKLTPEPNQPKSRTQRIGGWLTRFFRSSWQLPLLCILINVSALFTILRDPSPLTRRAVLHISMGVAAIWFSILNMSILGNNQSIRLQSADIIRHGETISQIVATLGRLADLTILTRETLGQEMQKLLGAVTELADSWRPIIKLAELTPPPEAGPDKSRHGKLSKLLATIRNLLGQ